MPLLGVEKREAGFRAWNILTSPGSGAEPLACSKTCHLQAASVSQSDACLVPHLYHSATLEAARIKDSEPDNSDSG